jgi:tetratricopeptide (TPR) repeat protein
MEQGKFPEAEQELNNALKLAEQFGEQDPRLIQSLTNLAILHNAKGEPEEAEILLQQTIAIHEKAPNPETTDLAASLSNLGALYVTQKKFNQAQQYFERALAIREHVQGPDDPETIRDLEPRKNMIKPKPCYSGPWRLRKHNLARPIPIWSAVLIIWPFSTARPNNLPKPHRF